MTKDTCWGSERIRGELLKLGFQISKRTVQKYMHGIQRPPSNLGGTWNTFIKNHLAVLYAMDFTTVINTSCFLKEFQVFFVISLQSRKIIHFNVTHHPTREWVIRQLKEATPFLDSPFYLIHDNDARFKYIDYASLGITPVRTAVRAPNMNAFMERFMRTVKQECLRHFIFFSEKHLYRVLAEYVQYYNTMRPHQGLGNVIPASVGSPPTPLPQGPIKIKPILNGLHYHFYREAA